MPPQMMPLPSRRSTAPSSSARPFPSSSRRRTRSRFVRVSSRSREPILGSSPSTMANRRRVTRTRHRIIGVLRLRVRWTSAFMSARPLGKAASAERFTPSCSPVLRKRARFIAPLPASRSRTTPAVAFHQRFGFEPVGIYREVGYKFARWIDVSWWQRGI